MKFKVSVIAGTPVDTKMGSDYLNLKKQENSLHEMEIFDHAVSGSCDEQIQFQYKSFQEKKEKLDQIFDPAISQGIRNFFIYCNSISAAFDFDAYALEKDVFIYTPLQVYADLAKKCQGAIAVMAANNLSAHKIEAVIMDHNPELYVLGVGNMQLVNAIERAVEENISPGQIIDRLGIEELIRFYEKNDCKYLVLGCTHFPYLKEELSKMTSMTLIDPAEEMFKALIEHM